MQLSERIQSVQESKTLRFRPLIEQLRAEGKKVIDFAMGEPDFDTPEEIKSATKKALDNNKTRYAQTAGIADLKKAICKKLKQNNLEYAENEILVSNGSKQILYELFQVLCNPGDEVIIPVPYWVSFAEQVKLASATPIFVETKAAQLDVKKIKAALTKKTKAIIINTPNNPSGAVYRTNDVKEIAELAAEKEITIVSDEAYEMLVYDGLHHVSVASLSSKIKKQTVTVQSFSKPYSMMGFRIGYCAAEKEIITAMSRLQDHLSSNACTFAQYGAIEAYQMNQSDIKKRIAQLEKHRNVAYAEVTKVFDCIKPQGAFFLFPDVSKVLGKRTAEEFSMFLLKEANVAVVPGDAFGAPKNIRISYTRPIDEIKEGFARIKDALKKWK